MQLPVQLLKCTDFDLFEVRVIRSRLGNHPPGAAWIHSMEPHPERMSKTLMTVQTAIAGILVTIAIARVHVSPKNEVEATVKIGFDEITNQLLLSLGQVSLDRIGGHY